MNNERIGQLDYEHPDFEEVDIEIPEGFEDNHWHNDTMPRWTKSIGNDMEIDLWVDYADEEKSEYPEGQRFLVKVRNAKENEAEEEFSSDDYDEVLSKISDFENKYGQDVELFEDTNIFATSELKEIYAENIDVLDIIV